jgi:N-methylhydantoinase A
MSSREGLRDLARRLGSSMSPEELAAGIIEIANWQQANRIRQMTIQRGIDPRQFALLSFGGAGPVQSAAVVQLIGMKACIVPPNPGNLAAFGLLTVDWRNDQMVTKVMHQDAVDLSTVAKLYGGLEQNAVQRLERDGIPQERIRLVREADIRYVGQSMELRVEAPGGDLDEQAIDRLLDAFHAAHRRNFGYDYKGDQKVEIVNLCVSGFGVIERPSLPKLPASSDKPEPRGQRPVWFDKGFVETPIYDRQKLAPGAVVAGPSIVEEFGSTTVVFPGQKLTVDDHGIMIVTQG